MSECPNCESDQLVEDDSTGQLICADCGAATGVYRGLTQVQSQDCNETRGLRVVYKPEKIISTINLVTNDPNSDSILASSTQPKLSQDLFDDGRVDTTSQNNMTNAHDQDFVERILIKQSLEEQTLEREEEWNSVRLKVKSRERSRPWRLSEPFTYILRRQTNILLELFNDQLDSVRFEQSVWRLWHQYLAITGELGVESWTQAAHHVAYSQLVLHRHQSRCLRAGAKSRRPQSLLPDLSNPTNDEWNTIRSHLSRLQWAGWGTLYEPDEGREVLEHFDLDEQKISKVVRLFKKPSQPPSDGPPNRGRKRKPPPRRVDETDSDDDHDDDDEVEMELFESNPKRTKLTVEFDDSVSDNDSVIQSTVDGDQVTSQKLDEGDDDDGDDELGDEIEFKSSSVQNGKPELRRSLVKSLSQANSFCRIFWRGLIDCHGCHSHRLLEHNLAVLFLTSLTSIRSKPVQNALAYSICTNVNYPFEKPQALTQMITLRDLQELCIDHKLPFIHMEKSFPANAFVVHDRHLVSVIRRSKPPAIDHLVYATVQIMKFSGLVQLPKFPLYWLVNRHFASLGLPTCFEQYVKPLMHELNMQSDRLNSQLTKQNYVQLIPWSRVLRPEVFAMALVIILLRLVFKLDDLFEHRLDLLAQKYAPNVSHFNWCHWYAYLNARFSLASSPQTESKLYPTNLLLTANRNAQLRGLKSAAEFLGNSEFQVGVNVGWGETNWKPVKLAQVTNKLAMSQIFRDIYQTESVPASNRFDQQSSHTSALSPSSIVNHSSHMERIGLSSPFRHSQVDWFLSDNCQMLPNVVVDEDVAEWFDEWMQSRYDYYPICTGSWAQLAKVKTRLKNRNRTSNQLKLPKAVLQLVAKHEWMMAKALDTEHDRGDDDDSGGKDEVVGKWSDLMDEYECGVSNLASTKSQSCYHCQSPSQNMKWLLEMCTVLSGASSQQCLLNEVECLERLLNWSAQPLCCSSSLNKIKPVDLSVLSCFDLGFDH